MLGRGMTRHCDRQSRIYTYNMCTFYSPSRRDLNSDHPLRTVFEETVNTDALDRLAAMTASKMHQCNKIYQVIQFLFLLGVQPQQEMS